MANEPNPKTGISSSVYCVKAILVIALHNSFIPGLYFVKTPHNYLRFTSKYVLKYKSVESDNCLAKIVNRSVNY